MRLRADLRFLIATALLGATLIAPAHAANPYPRCPDGRPRYDSLSCYYSTPRQCWVTMSGIGVCAPVADERVPSPRRRSFREGRR
jgi:hypothetical protein